VRLSSLAIALGVTACGSTAANDVAPVAYEGTLPAPVSARYFFNTLTVATSVDGATSRPLLVDTGSPLTGVDPSSWPDANLPANFSVLSSLVVGPLTFEQVPSVPLTECGTTCGAYDVTGVLGGNVLRSFVVGFDYQAPRVVLGPSTVPTDAQASAITVGLDVEGGGTGTIAGGNGQVVDVPPTRLVLQATVEGTARTLIVDTGSSYTLLRQSLFATMVSDGRSQISLTVSTATGAAQGSVARTHTLSVGAAQASGSPVGSVPDDEVDDLATEIGGSVDGMLGGSFLRAFYTTVDYGGQQLSLYPFVTADPLADEFDRVGVFLAENGDGYVVAQAVEPSEEGLVGEVLVDVDGTPVAGLDPDQADRLLRGAPGTSHTLHLQTAGGIEAQTLPVQDVLPLSP
jgi:Aspartyl protease